MYKIELTANFLAKQGLKSLVRETAKEVPLAPATGFETKLKLGFVFRDNQIKDTGWFFDSDDYQTHVDDLALLLENKKWTDYFEFRPTYELVAK